MIDQRLTDRPGPRQSYDPEGLGHSFAAEVERLRSQVVSSWAVERRRLAGLGVADGQRIFEPGCGPGLFTQRLAGWLAHSSIVALDRDPRMLAAAQATLHTAGLDGRVQLVRGAIEATGLPDGAFDVAISRYVFQHLADPLAAAVEVRRLLRPGGLHVVIDVDDGLWGLAEPHFAEFAEWHRRRAALQGRRGGDRFRGRRLGRLLRTAGYRSVELDVFAYTSDEAGLEAFAAQLDPDQFLPLVERGLLTLGEYARARQLHAAFLRAPEAFVLSVGFIAAARSAA